MILSAKVCTVHSTVSTFIYGLDIDPGKPNNEEAIKKQAAEVLNEFGQVIPDKIRAYVTPELEQITILGRQKLSENGKAIPVKTGPRNYMRCFRNVF